MNFTFCVYIMIEKIIHKFNTLIDFPSVEYYFCHIIHTFSLRCVSFVLVKLNINII